MPTPRPNSNKPSKTDGSEADGLRRRRLPELLLCAISAVLIFSLFAPYTRRNAAGEGAAAFTIPVLAYHEISPAAASQYQTSPDLFAKQMDALKAYGYQTIHLDDLMAYRDSGAPLPEKPIILTFDDGLQGNYQFAYPILKDHGFTATFFIITGKIGETEDDRQSNASWDSNAPLSYHLIWPEIEAMSADGFEFGSHTVEHFSLTSTYSVTSRTEIEQSRLQLQQHLPGAEINFITYPHGVGSTDPLIRAMIEQAGYRAALTYPENGTPIDPLNVDVWSLPRISIYSNMTLILDVNNPWRFFMRRVDPAFPLPNIGIYSKAFYDSWRTFRRTFYPGETITMNIQISNWSSAANDVRGSVSLFAPQKIFDSSMTDPRQDLTTIPLPKGNPSGIFTYTLTAPTVTVKSPISYTFSVYDPSGLLTYYTLPLTITKMTIEPSPINVEASSLEWLGVQTPQPVTFTVSSDSPTAEETFLTINLSPGLMIASSSPASAWKIYPPGSLIKKRGCASACMLSYLIMGEVKVAIFGAGERQYTLWVSRRPDAIDTEWITFRLAMRIPYTPIPYWYLRNPMYGIYDQQDYFAKKIEIKNPLSFRVYIPKL